VRITLSTFEYDRNLIGGAGIYALELSRWLAPLCQLTVRSCGAYQTPPLDVFAAAWFGAGVPNADYLNLPRSLSGHGEVAFYYYALTQKPPDGCDAYVINDLSQGVAPFRDIPLVQILHHMPSLELKQVPFSRKRVAITLLAAFEKRALKRAHAVICQSKDTMAHALERYPEHAEKMSIIPNGVDVRIFTPADTKAEATAGETPIIACVARGLERRKGIPKLLEALAAARRVTPVDLVIIGTGPQRVKQRMLAYAREQGIIDAITLVDSVSLQELIALYQRAAVTVVPSLFEGFGRPALESMACGTPVVGTTVGALPELVDESCGLLVAPGDVSALATALLDLLADERSMKRMGAAARQRAVALFSWDRVAQRVLNVCEEAASA